MDLMARRNLIMGGKKEYIVFEDPIVEQICVSNWSSDGIGLTKADAARVTTLVKGNDSVFFRTNITKFNELQYFIGLNPSNMIAWFQECRQMTEITFPTHLSSLNIMTNSILYRCDSLLVVNNAPVCNGTWNNYLKESVSIQSFVCPEGVTTLTTAFYLCSQLTYLDLPSTITTINAYSLIKNNNKPGWVPYRTLICRAITPPSLNNTADGITTDSNTRICVPYSADHSILNAYKAAATWSMHASKIYELNQDGTVPS